jgi:cation diffusion facilitator family transporter
MMPAGKPKVARFYAFLSIGAAISTITLKFGAYKLTGSISLFSDALESLVNLVAAIATLGAVVFAAKPADAQYSFGYSKAEYLSSALEGVMILIAAASICVASVDRLFHPQSIEQVGWGIIISIIATLINGRVAIALLRAGKRLRSIALKSDGRHLLTDVWTSVGIIVGLVAANLTGWQVLDPLIAIERRITHSARNDGWFTRCSSAQKRANDHQKSLASLSKYWSLFSEIENQASWFPTLCFSQHISTWQLEC